MDHNTLGDLLRAVGGSQVCVPLASTNLSHFLLFFRADSQLSRKGIPPLPLPRMITTNPQGTTKIVLIVLFLCFFHCHDQGPSSAHLPVKTSYVSVISMHHPCTSVPSD
jgi:hypothetical protein